MLDTVVLLCFYLLCRKAAGFENETHMGMMQTCTNTLTTLRCTITHYNRLLYQVWANEIIEKVMLKFMLHYLQTRYVLVFVIHKKA